MNLLAIDFETFFSADYSLSKMTTEEYVRSPLFEVICVTVRDSLQSHRYTGTMHNTKVWLEQFELHKHAVVAHNAMFDMAILSWHFDIRPKLILDTLSMASGIVPCNESKSLSSLSAKYLPHIAPKGTATNWAKGKRREDFTQGEMSLYMDYCDHDGVLCWELFKVLGKLYGTALRDELKLIDWTIRAFTEPKLVLDRAMLDKALIDYRTGAAKLLADAGVTDPGELRSDTLFADMLRRVGIDPPMKVSKSTGEPAFAFARTDPDFMALEEHEDERVQVLVAARLGHKSSITESRIIRLMDISTRGALPVPLNYYGALPGRWSGTDKINLQNVPKEGPLRASIRAPKGFRLLVVDLSQIELRLLLWAAGQHDKLDILRRGGDVYSLMASDIYRRPINKDDDPVERFVGKTAELGCGYGIGKDRFAVGLKNAASKYHIEIEDTSLDFAAGVVNAYRASHPNVTELWRVANNMLTVLAQGGEGQLGPFRVSGGAVWMPNGMPTRYPDLALAPGQDGRLEWFYQRRRRGMQSVKLYGAKLVENTIQGAARVVMTEGLLRIIKYMRVLGTVHDELWCLIPNTVSEERAVSWVREQITIPPKWAPDLPLACDIGVGNNYDEAK